MKVLRTENGLYDTTSKIHSRYYSCKICELKTVYMIPPVKSTAGIIHVSLCQPKTVYVITPVQFTAGIIHVSMCELKTVYVVPRVQSTADIIHVRL